uniref:Uncharacterized protein n=1 Tax=Arion vulgaris TaxID=1028688 RepID=A0A0B6ZD71_9EUPU
MNLFTECRLVNIFALGVHEFHSPQNVDSSSFLSFSRLLIIIPRRKQERHGNKQNNQLCHL